jgi:glycosyltransferase involved in cell wall biosynthesis
LVEGVARRYWGDPSALAKAFMQHSAGVACENPHTVAMYYHKRVGGGVEKVMEYLTGLYQSMGLEVVLITDIQGPEDKLDVPQGVRFRTVPNAGSSAPGSYIDRARALGDILTEEGVDVLLHHAWNTSLLPWDILCAHAAGVPVLVHAHSVFSMRALLGQAYFASMPWVFGMADGIVCLGEVDGAYWSKFNRNVHCVCNPLNTALLDMPRTNHDSNVLLWVGRLESEKRPYDAITIFAKVHEVFPDVRLQMLGKAPTEQAQLGLEAYAEKLEVFDSIEFCGFQAETAEFYRNAAVMLVTSEYEGFPLALSEASMVGLPVVMYELPYLTLVRGNEGITPVPMGDADRAAQAVAGLFYDSDLRHRQGDAGRAFMTELTKFDYRGAWESIFSSLAHPRSAEDLSTPDMVMWQTMMSHYRIGVDKLARRGWQTDNGKAEEYRLEIEAIHSSATYKIGRFITWPVRKLRTFCNCIKEHGMAETISIYTNRG